MSFHCLDHSYSVVKAAAILGVSRQTIYKYLSIDAPEFALIPPQAWFRLPSAISASRSGF